MDALLVQTRSRMQSPFPPKWYELTAPQRMELWYLYEAFLADTTDRRVQYMTYTRHNIERLEVLRSHMLAACEFESGNTDLTAWATELGVILCRNVDRITQACAGNQLWEWLRVGPGLDTRHDF